MVEEYIEVEGYTTLIFKNKDSKEIIFVDKTYHKETVQNYGHHMHISPIWRKILVRLGILRQCIDIKMSSDFDIITA